MGCFFQYVRPYKSLYDHLLAEPSFVVCGAFLLWKAVCAGLFIIRGASFSHCVQCFFCYIRETSFSFDWSEANCLMRLQSARWVPQFWSSLFKFSSFDCFKHGSYIEWVRTRYSDILKGKFEAERVETEVVVCILDGNVASLGLSKIGNRSNGSENFAQILRKKTKERATVRGETIQKEWGRREIYFFSTDLQ